MKSMSEVYVVSMIVDMMKDGHVNLDHFLQRESFKWSPKQRVRLIDTLIRGYPFPAIYAIKENDATNDLTILDGKQRLLTIKAFVIDESFAFKCSEPILVDGTAYEVNGLKFSQMPEAVQRRIKSANFSVITFTGYTVDDIYEIFDRLNNGTPLTKAEKCKPLMGDRMIMRLRRIIGTGFFEKTGINQLQMDKGSGYMALIHTLMLMRAEGDTGLSSSQTSRFLSQSSASISDAEYDMLDETVKWLGETADEANQEHCREWLGKMSVAPILYVLSAIWGDEEKMLMFRLNLEEFLGRETQPEEYMELCQKSTDHARVNGRVNYFLAMTKDEKAE